MDSCNNKVKTNFGPLTIHHVNISWKSFEIKNDSQAMNVILAKSVIEATISWSLLLMSQPWFHLFYRYDDD